MNRLIVDSVKVIVIFLLCTSLFYYGLKLMHLEYKQLHKYDAPQGPAVKVYQAEKSFIDRLNLFFRLGE